MLTHTQIYFSGFLGYDALLLGAWFQKLLRNLPGMQSHFPEDWKSLIAPLNNGLVLYIQVVNVKLDCTET